MFGKVKTYSWQEILELNRERNEGIVAVFTDGTVLKFVQTEERVYMEQFCEMNDLTIEPYGTKESFEMSFHPLIRFCCGFTFFVGIGFWLLSLPFEIYGFVTGLIFLLFFAFFVYAELFYKLSVKHRTLCEKRFLSREKRIPYSEVHKCSVEKRFKGQFMCFHTSKGIEISVPIGIGNYELLKQVAEDEGWLIKE